MPFKLKWRSKLLGRNPRQRTVIRRRLARGISLSGTASKNHRRKLAAGEVAHRSARFDYANGPQQKTVVYLFAKLGFLFGTLAALAFLISVFAAQVFAATIDRRDRATDALITDFRCVINEDIAHKNASTTQLRSYSRVVTLCDDATAPLDPGEYLVTVLAGPFPVVPGETGRDCAIDDLCGYKLGGQHFESVGSNVTVTVNLVPNPLPLATLRVRAFRDNHGVTGEDDVPVEEGTGPTYTDQGPFGDKRVVPGTSLGIRIFRGGRNHVQDWL